MRHPTQRRTGNSEFVFTSKLFVSLTACGLIFFLAEFACAGSATWELDPISGDWNTAANWTPNGVPNGTAAFAKPQGSRGKREPNNKESQRGMRSKIN